MVISFESNTRLVRMSSISSAPRQISRSRSTGFRIVWGTDRPKINGATVDKLLVDQKMFLKTAASIEPVSIKPVSIEPVSTD